MRCLCCVGSMATFPPLQEGCDQAPSVTFLVGWGPLCYESATCLNLPASGPGVRAPGARLAADEVFALEVGAWLGGFCWLSVLKSLSPRGSHSNTWVVAVGLAYSSTCHHLWCIYNQFPNHERKFDFSSLVSVNTLRVQGNTCGTEPPLQGLRMAPENRPVGGDPGEQGWGLSRCLPGCSDCVFSPLGLLLSVRRIH